MIRTLAVTGLNLVSHINSQNFSYHSTQVFSGKIFLPGAFLLWKATSELFFVNNFSLVHLSRGQFHPNYSPVKKWSFPLRISSVNVTTSAFPADLVTFTEEILNENKITLVYFPPEQLQRNSVPHERFLWHELISYKETLANL